MLTKLRVGLDNANFAFNITGLVFMSIHYFGAEEY